MSDTLQLVKELLPRLLESLFTTSKKCTLHLASSELAYNFTTMNLQLADEFTTSG